MLDHTKSMELHAYIYEQKPDIIILNEPWLKPTILDNEIIPNNLYKVFDAIDPLPHIQLTPIIPKSIKGMGRGSYSHKTVINTFIQYY